MKTAEFFGEYHNSDGLFDATVAIFQQARDRGVKKIFLEGSPNSQESVDRRISERTEMFADPQFSVDSGLQSFREKYLATVNSDKRNTILLEAKLGMAAAYGIQLICADNSDDCLTAIHLVMDEAYIKEKDFILSAVQRIKDSLPAHCEELGATEEGLTAGLEAVEQAFEAGNFFDRKKRLEAAELIGIPFESHSPDGRTKAYYLSVCEAEKVAPPHTLSTNARLAAIEHIKAKLSFFAGERGMAEGKLLHDLGLVESSLLSSNDLLLQSEQFKRRLANDKGVAAFIFGHCNEGETVYVIYGGAHCDLNRQESNSIPTALIDLGMRVAVHKIHQETGDIHPIFESLRRPDSMSRQSNETKPDTPR